MAPTHMVPNPIAHERMRPAKAPNPWRIMALVLAVAVTLVPPAMAGTEADPEIEDRPGDAARPTSATVGAQDALDMVAVWIAEEADDLSINWKVVALTAPGPAERFEYNLDFTVNDTAFIAQVWRQKSDGMVGGGIWGTDDGPCAHTASDLGLPATLQTEEGTGVISFTVPRSFLTGCPMSQDRALEGIGRLTDLRATTFHCVMARGNTCDSESTPDDAGPGRDFVFASLAIAPDNRTLTDGDRTDAPGPGPTLVLMTLGALGAFAARGRRKLAR